MTVQPETELATELSRPPLWCGFPGENHPISLPISPSDAQTLERGGLIRCPVHFADTVGRLPPTDDFGPADT